MNDAAAENSIGWPDPRLAKILTPVLLLFGVECWLVIGRGNWGHSYKPLLILGAIVAGLIPPLRNAFNRLWLLLQNPSQRTRWCVALALTIGVSLFLYWTQRYEKIAIHPKWQDEFSYLIQTRMLAHGRLWEPAPACPEFFDSFYILVQPVYASMYFPGAAMMYVPALWLQLPYFVGPLAASGLCAGLLYLIITEILDGASGLLAVLLLVSLGMFRMMSVMVMAQTPALLLGLIMTWAALRWRDRKRQGWLALLGAAAGWAAITRPADAFCFAIVVGTFMLPELWNMPARVSVGAAAWVVIAALPFLAVQLAFDRNVTGHWLTTPFAYYTQLNYPGAFGFHQGEAPLHVSNIPEKQLFYEYFVKGVIEQHQLKNLISIGLRGEFAAVSTAAVPDSFFWLILPMSLLAIWRRRFWVVWGMIPVYLIVLLGYSFSAVLPHYVVVVIPAMIFLCLLPIRFLTDTFPRRAAMIRTMLGLGILAVTVVNLPQMDRLVHDQYFETPELDRITAVLNRNVTPPAVVLFHFNRDTMIDGRKVTDDPNQEPVFNSDVAWPDDAPIIRAHDLNESVSAIGTPTDRDRPLYEYYARIAPDRVFYLYDRHGGPGELRRLGTAEELFSKLR